MINSVLISFLQSMAHKWNKNGLACSTIEFFEHIALCKFEKRLSQTFAFTSVNLDCPEFVFHTITVETAHFCTVLVLAPYRTYQDAF